MVKDTHAMDRPTALVPRHYVAVGPGPEDVVADPRGRVLTGVADGRILRLDALADPVAARVEVIAETGGRPLGLELLPDGDLLVCDAERGLLRVDTGNGTVRILADAVAGEPLRFCSNAVALSDGSVYFTVSSRRYPLEHWIGDIVEHTGTGRHGRAREQHRVRHVAHGDHVIVVAAGGEARPALLDDAAQSRRPQRTHDLGADVLGGRRRRANPPS